MVGKADETVISVVVESKKDRNEEMPGPSNVGTSVDQLKKQVI